MSQVSGSELKLGDICIDYGIFLEFYIWHHMEHSFNSSGNGIERGYIFVQKNGKRKEIRDDSLKKVFNKDDTFERDCLLGLDTIYIKFKPSSDKKLNNAISENNNRIVNKSRVLCLFKLLYHKFIFIDVNFIFELIQNLLLENLVDDSK